MNVKAPKPARPLLELEHFLPYRLNVVAESVSRALSRLYAERYGIGVPEWRVIATLGEYEHMTAKDVGAHSRMHKTKVSRAVTALEAKGLIERHQNPQDRRSILIALTDHGQALVPRLRPVFGRVTRQLFNGFSTHEIGVLTTTLERMRGNLATTPD